MDVARCFSPTPPGRHCAAARASGFATTEGPTQQANHALRLAAHGRHDIAHDLQPVEALGVRPKRLPQTPAECLPQHCADVELRDARAHEPLDVLLADT